MPYPEKDIEKHKKKKSKEEDQYRAYLRAKQQLKEG